MHTEEKFDLLNSDRINRIMQHEGLTFPKLPPDRFIRAVLACVDEWHKHRAARHRPTGLIYHYCDATALLNILKTRRVWATSTKYLNDTRELLVLSAGMRTHAGRHRKTAAGEALSDIVDFYWIASDTRQTQTIGMDRFACCFSTDGDLLSQWRAYGNDGRGYAIGFEPSAFAGLAGPNPTMSLRRITYGGEREAELIDELFAHFMPTVADHVGILDSTGWDGVPARNWLSMRFGECLLGLAEEIKSRAFSEEKEWRLYGGGSQEVQFRVSQDRIVPYQQLDLSSEKKPAVLPIGEIVVGPKLDFAEAMVSLTTYTSTLGYGTAMNIRQSRASYR